MKKKPEYVLCPRCELNYIIAGDKKRKYCDVCLAELNLVDPGILIPDEDAELEVICPACKINYMSPDEEICFLCAKERGEKEVIEPDDVEGDNWNYADEEPLADDPIEISLSELAEEEEAEEEDDEYHGPGDEDDFEDILDGEDWDEDDEDGEEDEEEDY